MAHFVLNNLESHLLFKGGYVELKALEWTRVMSSDVRAGLFEEAEARNQVTIFEGDSAPPSPYTKNAIVFATSPMDSGMTAEELLNSMKPEVPVLAPGPVEVEVVAEPVAEVVAEPVVVETPVETPTEAPKARKGKSAA